MATIDCLINRLPRAAVLASMDRIERDMAALSRRLEPLIKKAEAALSHRDRLSKRRRSTITRGVRRHYAPSQRKGKRPRDPRPRTKTQGETPTPGPLPLTSPLESQGDPPTRRTPAA